MMVQISTATLALLLERLPIVDIVRRREAELAESVPVIERLRVPAAVEAVAEELRTVRQDLDALATVAAGDGPSGPGPGARDPRQIDWVDLAGVPAPPRAEVDAAYAEREGGAAAELGPYVPERPAPGMWVRGAYAEPDAWYQVDQVREEEGYGLRLKVSSEWDRRQGFDANRWFVGVRLDGGAWISNLGERLAFLPAPDAEGQPDPAAIGREIQAQLRELPPERWREVVETADAALKAAEEDCRAARAQAAGLCEGCGGIPAAPAGASSACTCGTAFRTFEERFADGESLQEATTSFLADVEHELRELGRDDLVDQPAPPIPPTPELAARDRELLQILQDAAAQSPEFLAAKEEASPHVLRLALAAVRGRKRSERRVGKIEARLRALGELMEAPATAEAEEEAQPAAPLPVEPEEGPAMIDDRHAPAPYWVAERRPRIVPPYMPARGRLRQLCWLDGRRSPFVNQLPGRFNHLRAMQRPAPYWVAIRLDGDRGQVESTDGQVRVPMPRFDLAEEYAAAWNAESLRMPPRLPAAVSPLGAIRPRARGQRATKVPADRLVTYPALLELRLLHLEEAWVDLADTPHSSPRRGAARARVERLHRSLAVFCADHSIRTNRVFPELTRALGLPSLGKLIEQHLARPLPEPPRHEDLVGSAQTAPTGEPEEEVPQAWRQIVEDRNPGNLPHHLERVTLAGARTALRELLAQPKGMRARIQAVAKRVIELEQAGEVRPTFWVSGQRAPVSISGWTAKGGASGTAEDGLARPVADVVCAGWNAGMDVVEWNGLTFRRPTWARAPEVDDSASPAAESSTPAPEPAPELEHSVDPAAEVVLQDDEEEDAGADPFGKEPKPGHPPIAATVEWTDKYRGTRTGWVWEYMVAADRRRYARVTCLVGDIACTVGVRPAELRVVADPPAPLSSVVGKKEIDAAFRAWWTGGRSDAESYRPWWREGVRCAELGLPRPDRAGKGRVEGWDWRIAKHKEIEASAAAGASAQLTYTVNAWLQGHVDGIGRKTAQGLHGQFASVEDLVAADPARLTQALLESGLYSMEGSARKKAVIYHAAIQDAAERQGLVARPRPAGGGRRSTPGHVEVSAWLVERVPALISRDQAAALAGRWPHIAHLLEASAEEIAVAVVEAFCAPGSDARAWSEDVHAAIQKAARDAYQAFVGHVMAGASARDPGEAPAADAPAEPGPAWYVEEVDGRVEVVLAGTGVRWLVPEGFGAMERARSHAEEWTAIEATEPLPPCASCGACRPLVQELCDECHPDPFAHQVREGESRCVICGCTDSQACPEGCYWVSVDRDAQEGVCSTPACVAAGVERGLVHPEHAAAEEGGETPGREGWEDTPGVAWRPAADQDPVERAILRWGWYVTQVYHSSPVDGGWERRLRPGVRELIASIDSFESYQAVHKAHGWGGSTPDGFARLVEELAAAGEAVGAATTHASEPEPSSGGRAAPAPEPSPTAPARFYAPPGSRWGDPDRTRLERNTVTAEDRPTLLLELERHLAGKRQSTKYVADFRRGADTVTRYGPPPELEGEPEAFLDGVAWARARAFVYYRSYASMHRPPTPEETSVLDGHGIMTGYYKIRDRIVAPVEVAQARADCLLMQVLWEHSDDFYARMYETRARLKLVPDALLGQWIADAMGEPGEHGLVLPFGRITYQGWKPGQARTDTPEPWAEVIRGERIKGPQLLSWVRRITGIHAPTAETNPADIYSPPVIAAETLPVATPAREADQLQAHEQLGASGRDTPSADDLTIAALGGEVPPDSAARERDVTEQGPHRFFIREAADDPEERELVDRTDGRVLTTARWMEAWGAALRINGLAPDPEGLLEKHGIAPVAAAHAPASLTAEVPVEQLGEEEDARAEPAERHALVASAKDEAAEVYINLKFRELFVRGARAWADGKSYPADGYPQLQAGFRWGARWCAADRATRAAIEEDLRASAAPAPPPAPAPAEPEGDILTIEYAAQVMGEMETRCRDVVEVHEVLQLVRAALLRDREGRGDPNAAAFWAIDGPKLNNAALDRELRERLAGEDGRALEGHRAGVGSYRTPPGTRGCLALVLASSKRTVHLRDATLLLWVRAALGLAWVGTSPAAVHAEAAA
jgi:hypothetical protein